MITLQMLAEEARVQREAEAIARQNAMTNRLYEEAKGLVKTFREHFPEAASAVEASGLVIKPLVEEGETEGKITLESVVCIERKEEVDTGRITFSYMKPRKGPHCIRYLDGTWFSTDILTEPYHIYYRTETPSLLTKYRLAEDLCRFFFPETSQNTIPAPAK